MPSEWIKCNGLPEIAQTYQKIDVSFGNDTDDPSLCVLSVSPKKIVARESVSFWRPASVSGNGPAPPAPPVGSGQPPVADASSGYVALDMEDAARAIFGINALHNKEVDDAVYENAGTHLMDKFFGVQDTLNERGARYGDFTENAAISQHLKQVLQHDGHDVREGWLRLSLVQREALEMIAQKIARILNGDPNYKDNWHDIQGYARLAEERCKSSD